MSLHSRILCFCALLGGASLALLAETGPAAAFADSCRRAPAATLVILEPGRTSLKTSLQTLVDHESMMPWSIRINALMDTANGRKIRDYARQRHGLDPRTQWALIDRQERCLASGVQAPGLEEVAEVLEKAGLKPWVIVLRDFVKSHPDHLGARALYLKELRDQASRRTNRLLKLSGRALGDEGKEAVDKAYNELSEPLGGVPSTPKPLDDEQDLRIWGTLARELDRLFQSLDWPRIDLSWSTQWQYPSECHSPFMRALFRRHLPTVQAALLRHPANLGLWKAWLWMFQVTGEKSVRTFIQALEPLPRDLGGVDWPPFRVRKALMEEARRSHDWSSVREVLWTQWEQLLEDSRRHSRREIHPEDLRTLQMLRSDEWKEFLEPLLEALVRCGDEGGADQVVQEIREWPGWQDLDARLGSLVRRLGRPQWLARWGALPRATR